jgi:hypothetical protein
VRGLLSILKKLFFWNYERNTWQWDVLCVLILVFIFLTPKDWFPVGERPKSIEHQSPVTMTVVLGPQVVANETDKKQITESVKALTGRSEVEVLAVRKVLGSDGRVLSFEVDIR